MYTYVCVVKKSSHTLQSSAHSLQCFATMHCSVLLNQVCNSCSSCSSPHFLRSMHMAHKTWFLMKAGKTLTTNSKLFIHFNYIELIKIQLGVICAHMVDFACSVILYRMKIRDICVDYICMCSWILY